MAGGNLMFSSTGISGRTGLAQMARHQTWKFFNGLNLAWIFCNQHRIVCDTLERVVMEGEDKMPEHTKATRVMVGMDPVHLLQSTYPGRVADLKNAVRA